MKKFLKEFFDIKLLKFGIVGIINTVVGMIIMFGLYNVFHLSYWISSGCNYFFTSILSYFLNKTFTFKDQSSVAESGLRFFINILICYLLAYGLAKPLISLILSDLPLNYQDNISMLLGMCFFVGFNYIGQRFFVFRDQKK